MIHKAVIIPSDHTYVLGTHICSFALTALENDLISILTKARMKGSGMQVYPRIARHDSVVAIVIQRGRGCVQSARPIWISTDAVVVAPFWDLFSIFEPVHLNGHKPTEHVNDVIEHWFFFPYIFKY